VSNKEGTFFEESGHDSREKFSVNFWSKYFSVVGGHTIHIHTVCMIPYSLYIFGLKIEEIFGTIRA
jgi:hypothetical protein